MLSTDNTITDRVVASEIKNNSIFLIKRETNLRKLWATNTLFTTIPCLEMMEVPISECCNYVDDCTVGRTKFKLPRISEGNYNYLIQGVYSINVLGGKGKKLKEISVNRYLNLLKLPVITKEEYFWIVDGYLYVNNPSVKKIRISAFFEEDVPNNIMFPDQDCEGCSPDLEEYCKNPLDKEYSLPGYLVTPVLELTSKKLLSTYFNIKMDMTSNNIDGQSVNSKPGD